MIVVLCGTQRQSFDRLWNQLQPLFDAHSFYIQAGHNPWQSDQPSVVIRDFLSPTELHDWIEQADLIITHAGAGSMLQALHAHKKVIAVPRLTRFKEHVNDHQQELATKFETLGYLKVLRPSDSLTELIEELSSFTPTPYLSQPTLPKMLHQRLTQLLSA